MSQSLLDPLVLRSPAKINLFLHVAGRRGDGYHLLETAFQFLDFADTLRFESTGKPGVIRSDDHSWELPEHDLILRAAALIRSEYGNADMRGVRITLSKQIPPGSGMGGGSSNAATALLGLNRFWNLGLNRKQLSELGRQLGADVPVFIHGQSCWATGIGDIFETFQPEPAWFCLCIPEVEVSTAKVFSDPHLIRDTPSATPADYYQGRCSNTLEPVTRRLYSEVGKALDELAKYGEPAMNGTGSSVYLRTENHQEAKKISQKLPDWLNGFPVRSLNDIRQF